MKHIKINRMQPKEKNSLKQGGAEPILKKF